MAYKAIDIGVLETLIDSFNSFTILPQVHLITYQDCKARSTINMTTNADHASITACDNPDDIALRNLSASISLPKVSIAERYNITDDRQQDPVTVSPIAPISSNAAFTTAPTESSNKGDAIIQMGDLSTAAAGNTRGEPSAFDIENAGSFSFERSTLSRMHSAHL